MLLEDQIRTAILVEAEKLIQRYHQYHNVLHLDHSRKQERIAGVPAKQIKSPEAWDASKLHNPFYVRRKASSIAKSIAKKIQNESYAPNSPYIRKIPKAGGGFRRVSVYQVPDAAVSNLFYAGLLKKNKHRFSSFAYAYRNDRNVHFAIQDIAVDLQDSSRTFVAEFDFSDFFGSISHEFLLSQLKRNGFFISKDDEFVINAFIKSNGGRGIPQGTSISLFLANMVCWELDKKLERCGVKFARYADDTVIWTPEYEKICQAYSCIDDFSNEASVAINATKSAGISLLKKQGMPAEMASKDHVDFLGYSLSVNAVSIKARAVEKIKSQISYILAKHLLQPLRNAPLKALIIPANDQDRSLISAMAEIRRYLYGGLTNTQILNYIHGKTRRIYFKGLMSYYPLINDVEQLKMLDGWLVSAVHRAVRERGRLLAGHGHPSWSIFPFKVKRNSIVTQYRQHKTFGKTRYEVPSLSLLHSALTQAMRENGIEKVMGAASSNYDY